MGRYVEVYGKEIRIILRSPHRHHIILIIITMKSSVKEYGNEIGGLLRSAGKEPASSQLGEQVDSLYSRKRWTITEKREKSTKISEGDK